MEVTTIAVIGGGIMGTGIAHVAALGGYDTVLIDVQQAVLDKAQDTLAKNLAKGVQLGKLTAEQQTDALGRVRTALSLDDAASAQLVIEAVPEKIHRKIRIFAELDDLCSPKTIFASNTSGLSISEIAGGTRRPAQVIGMHFFNPVHKMRLIEIIRGKETSDATYATTRQVGVQMGKETVEVNESPGFVTSRMNAMIGNEAFYMLQEGVASARDIDTALKLGLNHPMGPFEMIDLVGLDTRLSILNHLHETLGDKYKPCPLIAQYVKEGRLGRKVGRGVYDYPAKDEKEGK